ncbi:MAG TPA: CHRD domain-containing protein [Vicinamibacterales bacterium]|nr:CHRD domain-containing protein [Vicinamibacterales bacterium]
MKRLFLTLALTAGALGAGVVSAHAETYTLTASLTGSEETPAPGINTGAFGSATVTVDTVARTVTYRVDVFNLPSGVTASHIHAGGVGTAGPVIINFAPPVNASNDFSYSGTVPESQWIMRAEQGIRSGDDVIQALLGNNTYVNVHSTVNGGGEVRGRLVRQN